MSESLGICIQCVETKVCFDTSAGSICRECWTDMAFDPRQEDPEAWKNREKIHIPPHPGQKTYIFMDGETFITVHGVLYGFEREEDAKTTLGRIGESSDIGSIRIELVEAIVPFLYTAQHPGLRMIGIKKIVNKAAP